MAKCFDYRIEREGTEVNLIVDCLSCPLYPSIEDHAFYMARIIDILVSEGHVTTITLSSERNYVYPFDQVKYLNQIADVYIDLVKRKNITSFQMLSKEKKFLTERYNVVIRILNMIKTDPVGAYLYTVRRIREEEAKMSMNKEYASSYQTFIRTLQIIKGELESTALIRESMPELPGYKIGDRSIYRRFFEPLIRPNFMFVRLMSEPPTNGIEIKRYQIGKKFTSDIGIYSIPGKTRLFYHIVPPELKLSEDEYILLTEAREIMAKYKPTKEEFINPERMRKVFFNIGKDLIEKIAKERGIKLEYSQIEKLAEILVRLTVGFGIVETFLDDPLLEDVYINSPLGEVPIVIKHSIYGECKTNVYVDFKEGESWVARFRMLSGRPLDEAHPVLDTELVTPTERARVAIIQRPLSPFGYSFAFRHHRKKPWTLPLYIKNRMINPLAAGLFSFLVDGARSILIAGTRGAGKTSLLSALMVEIMRKYRIITVEDTLELPTEYLKNIGYNIVPMKVRSAIVGEKSELSADEGIRTSLRLGDSSLIVGEVRSTEARALYEAMRVGALANVVAGTIHGDSPYGVFDRVVNDLGVPRTSFKATDIVVIANKLRTPSQLAEIRRVTSITEVRKTWTEDPLRENGFVDLMRYDTMKDELTPTGDMVEGGSEILKSIASKVKDWVGNWERVWNNIVLRGEIKKMLVDYSIKYNLPQILEANFVVEANDQFHNIFSRIKKEVGYPENEDVLNEFENWLKLRLKKYGK